MPHYSQLIDNAGKHRKGEEQGDYTDGLELLLLLPACLLRQEE